jgi:endonuclease/exonuclease/phosphatase family metal-dependent hydrolase
MASQYTLRANLFHPGPPRYNGSVPNSSRTSLPSSSQPPFPPYNAQAARTRAARSLTRNGPELPPHPIMRTAPPPTPGPAQASSPTPISSRSSSPTPSRNSSDSEFEGTRSITPEKERSYLDPTAHQFQVMTYNVGRSYDTTVSLFDDNDILDIDVINIQEPWLNTIQAKAGLISTYQGGHTSRFWCIMAEPNFPDAFGNNTVSTVTYINRRIHGQSTWRTMYATTHALRIQINVGGNNIDMINVYEAHSFEKTMSIQWQTAKTAHQAAMRTTDGPEGDQLKSIMSSIEAHWSFYNDNETHNRLILGDFNAHHHDWAGHRLSNNGKGTALVQSMKNLDLALYSTTGMITRTGNVTRGERDSVLDLVWGDHGLRYNLMSIETCDAQDYFSDHLPVIAHFLFENLLDKDPPATNVQARKAWAKMDQAILFDTLKTGIEELKTDITTIRDELPSTIDGVYRRLIQAVTTAIDASTPDARISDRSVPGFPPELKELVRVTRRAKRRASRKRTVRSENQYRKLKRSLKEAIRVFKRGQWRE